MKLAAHGWTLALLPEVGGSVRGLRHRDRDILRPGPADLTDPLQSGCFPLLPYTNRIAHGAFDHAGIPHRLPRNFGDHPHSLHGVGWLREWRIETSDDAAAVLSHGHAGDAHWPWPYRAEQRFTLAPDRATIALSLTNLADMPVPAGLGLHPYFPVDAATRLTARARGAWLADATMLPTARVAPDRFGDWASGASVEGDGLIDNAHDGWDGVARIEQSWGTLRIEARGASIFHLYRPPGEAFFCFEPVGHLPDAINRGGMDLLGPGETASLEMALSVAG